MNLQELRVGNWVLGHSHKMALGYVPAKVTTVGVKRVQLDRANGGEANNIKPIPITEEALLKCGFKQGDNILTNDHFYEHPIGGSVLTINPDNGVVWIYRNETSFNNPALICHLHQLQNLYFALTGRELDYTP